MSGIIGLSIFIDFSIKLIKKIIKDPFLLLPIMILYLYGFAGFAMRRLVYWGISTIIFMIAEKESKKQQTKY